MSISSEIRRKERAISDLRKCKGDLSDDSSDITSINRLVSELQGDFQRFIVSDNTRTVVDKIGEYLEPYQSSDSDLTQACSYIDSEIYKLQREIDALERALEAAARAKTAIDGNL
ncbi:MAG TPA: hypothetical protein GXX14_00360 [Clostridiaceae bacterium]|nr:hypothetical protein [Clostridiaceae bacterium]